MSKEHLMTHAEKEKFLKRVKIETEEISGTSDPKTEFLTKIDAYQESMIKQVAELEKLIKVQEYLLQNTEKLYNAVANDLPKDVLKSEISTKQEIILQARSSMILMRERIELGKKLKDELNANYNFLNDVDFYFNGALNMPELETRRTEILNKDKHNAD